MMNTDLEKTSNIGKNKKFARRVAVTIKLLTTIFLGIIFIADKSLYTIQNGNSILYETPKLAITSVIFVIITALILIKNPFTKKGNRVFAIICYCLTPFLIFMAMETVTGNYFNPRYLTPRMIFYNLAILAVIILLFTAITNSLRWGPLISSIICILFSIANYYVYTFRNIPILSTDFTTIGTAFDVIENYHFTMYYCVFFGLLILWGLIILSCWIKETRIFNSRGHTAFIISTVVFCCIFTKLFITSDFLKDHGTILRMFRPMDSYRRYGNAVTFSRSLAYAKSKKPTNYSPDAVKKITSEYTNQAETKADTLKPNIITIINESFSDLSVLGEFSTNEDYMPFIHSLSKTAITGTAYTSILGGQTANTEFEYLTNNSMAFLPSQSVAFQLYVKDKLPSLVTTLQAQGYGCNIGIHLGRPQNYQRDIVYPLLGFDDFYHRKNHHVGPKKRVRNFASDRFTYQNVINCYKDFRALPQNDGVPFEIYSMTIQNHGPYDSDDPDIPSVISLDTGYKNAEMERYLNLIKLSDEAFQDLVEYFQSIEEPTVILMFGDHQPKISNDFLDIITNGEFDSWTDEQMMARYAVPFVIWANYDIGTKRIEKTSINYLQTLLLEYAGLELTGYQRFLKELSSQVTAITGLGYFGAGGNFYQLNDSSSPYYDLIHDYSILQYNNMFDTQNRVKDFFDLPEKEDYDE